MLRVLIVEDETPIRELLNDFLMDEGFETLLAENGQHGVELAQTARPDLILMDLMLPQMDGIAAMRALKAHAETRAIPIILMSANTAMLLKTMDHTLASATIRKPFDLDDVLLEIQRGIGVDPADAYADAMPG